MANSITANDGRPLERLVALIEGCGLPPGFNVEVNDRVFNDEGIQIAEFDIIITGQIGTSPLKSLIECRDRPSDGPAPGSWIEQLVGRRDRFNFDQIMAVSTTGFAVGAKDYADQKGIELRVLEELTYEAVSSWLPFYAPLIIRHGNLNNIRVYLSSNSNNLEIQNLELDNSAKFRDVETGEITNFDQIWKTILNQNSTFDGIEVDAPPIQKTIIASLDFSKKYALIVENTELQVSRFEFDASLKVSTSQMPIVQAARYVSGSPSENNQGTFSELGRWKGKDDDVVKEIIVIGFKKA